MTSPPLLLPRVVRALLTRDARDAPGSRELPPHLERGQDLAARLATPRPVRRRRPTGWEGFRRVQADYDGAPDPDDG